MEKKKTLVQQYNIFLILTMKKYFYCLKIYEKLKKKPLINRFKSC